MSRPANRSSTLPTPTRGTCARPGGPAASGPGGGRLMSLRCARPLPGAGLPDERPRDHPRHRVRPLQQVPGLAAGGVELLQRNDFLVRRHLEDAVRRGVDDPAARCARCSSPNSSRIGRAGGGLVPEHAAPGAARETPARPRPGTRRDRWERVGQREAAELPVPGGAVLAGARGLAGAPRGPWATRPGRTPSSGAQHPRPSASSSGSVQAADRPRHVAEGVAARRRRRRRCRAPHRCRARRAR